MAAGKRYTNPVERLRRWCKDGGYDFRYSVEQDAFTVMTGTVEFTVTHRELVEAEHPYVLLLDRHEAAIMALPEPVFANA